MSCYNTRVIIGFDGTCPYDCKHCYVQGLDRGDKRRSINELIGSIEDEQFDIIYLSQKYENFFCEQAGFELSKSLYEKYRKDIYIITRCELSEDTITKLSELNTQMLENGHHLMIGVSFCAYQSYRKSESEMCPEPERRINCLRNLHNKGIATILLLRPIFPDKFIPVKEVQGIIYNAADYCDCIISSGLIASPKIMDRLGIDYEHTKFLEKGDSSYLDDIDDEEFSFLDVEDEIEVIKETAETVGKPFFRHSMLALNYICGKNKWEDKDDD